LVGGWWCSSAVVVDEFGELAAIIFGSLQLWATVCRRVGAHDPGWEGKGFLSPTTVCWRWWSACASVLLAGSCSLSPSAARRPAPALQRP
jgi:hypothetical protein